MAYGMFNFGSPYDNLMAGSNRTASNPSGLDYNTWSTFQNPAQNPVQGGMFSNFGMQDVLGLGGLGVALRGMNQAEDVFDFEKGIEEKKLAMLEEDRDYNKSVRENLRNIRF